MINQFKILVLLLITSTEIFAQPSEIEMDERHTIYKEDFATNTNTIFVLNLKNTSAQVLESPDDNVYIEYTIEFKNVRKKIKQRQLKHLLVSGTKQGNKITYSAKTRNDIRYSVYQFEDLLIGRLGSKDALQDTIPKPAPRKSLDSVLQDVKLSEVSRRNKIRDALGITQRQTERRKRSTNNLIISRMTIKIPIAVQVRATLENSNIVFMDDFYNRATMNIRNTKLRFKALGNVLNNFDVDNGSFNAEAVAAGKYSFANTKNVRIGRLENVFLNTEFTKVEIGEIGIGNTIIDFNSKFWLHNFSTAFESFKINSEYSEINLFYPENTDYYIETFGHDTFHHHGTIVGSVTSNQKNVSSKMMVIGKEINPNKIKINIKHGIVRFGDDFIDIAK